MKKILLYLLVLIFVSCATNKKISGNKIKNNKELRFKLTKKENMPYGAYDFAAELYKGNIYAFLGTKDWLTDKAKGVFGKVCKYNIKTDKWSVINTIPKYQSSATSTIIGNKIYLVGGYKFLNYIQVYNITDNKWEQKITIPIGLYWTTVESFENKIFIIGGYAKEIEGKGVRRLNDVQIYDTVLGEWSKGANFPIKSQSLNSLKYKNEFYVWHNSLVFKYAPKRDMWFQVTGLSNKLKNSQEGVVLNDQFIFISGQDGSGFKDKSKKKIFSYNPITKNFKESKDDLITGRHYSYGVFEYKNVVYILGGREDKEWNAMNDVIALKIKIK